MNTYRDVPPSIQVMLEDYCRQDAHGLRPSTLYHNIAGTLQTNSVTVTAVLFDVSVSLVWMIREAMAKNPKKDLTDDKSSFIL